MKIPATLLGLLGLSLAISQLHADPLSGDSLDIGSGNNNVPTSSCSAAFGTNLQFWGGGSNSVLIGDSNYSYTPIWNTLIVGEQNSAEFLYDSLVVGCYNTHAQGSTSLVVGDFNSAYVSDSLVVGDFNSVYISDGAVFGFNNAINGNYQFALGQGLVSDGNSNNGSGIAAPAIFLGQYNKYDSALLLAVGNGSDASHRANGFEVYFDGRIKAYNAMEIFAPSYNSSNPSIGKIAIQPSTSGSNITIDGKAVLTTSSTFSVNPNSGQVSVATSTGQSMFVGRQVGSGYSYPSGIFKAVTDNSNGNTNYYFQGVTGGPSGTTNFSVRADGYGYFAGSVGIGTPNPAAWLDVNGKAIVRNNMKIFASSEAWAEGLTIIQPSSWGGIRLTRNDPASGNYTGNWAIGYTGNTGNDFSITTYFNGAQYDGAFHISNATRNVGIGTTNPDEKLVVNGNIKAILSSTSPTKNVAGIVALNYSGVTGAQNWALRGTYQYPFGVEINAAGGDLDLIKSLDGNIILGTKTDGSALGNVGVGTTTPAAKLDVNGDAKFSGAINLFASNYNSSTPNSGKIVIQPSTTGSSITIDGQPLMTSTSTAVQSFTAPSYSFNSGSTNRMTIDSAGNVGIGTTTPSNLLNIYSSAASTPMKVVGVNGAYLAMAFDAAGRGNLTVRGEQGGTSNGGAYGIFDGYQEGFNTFIARSAASGARVMRTGYAANSGGYSNSFLIQSLNDAITGITATPFIIQNGAPSNSFFMSSAGNVGIGTTSPQAKLDVNGSVRFGEARFNVSEDSDAFVVYNDPDGAPQLRVDGDQKMVLLQETGGGGRVGVGTAIPQALLDVHGDTVLGVGLAANQSTLNTGQVIVGKYNDTRTSDTSTTPAATNHTQGVFIVAAGTSTTRANAIRVLDDGTVLVKSSGDIGMGSFTNGPKP